mgnify:CR=1 FL=1
MFIWTAAAASTGMAMMALAVFEVSSDRATNTRQVMTIIVIGTILASFGFMWFAHLFWPLT